MLVIMVITHDWLFWLLRLKHYWQVRLAMFAMMAMMLMLIVMVMPLAAYVGYNPQTAYANYAHFNLRLVMLFIIQANYIYML